MRSCKKTNQQRKKGGKKFKKSRGTGGEKWGRRRSVTKDCHTGRGFTMPKKRGRCTGRKWKRKTSSKAMQLRGAWRSEKERERKREWGGVNGGGEKSGPKKIGHPGNGKRSGTLEKTLGGGGGGKKNERGRKKVRMGGVRQKVTPLNPK